ncbi:hypothetical protein BS17DRAFT_785513 [Gyrodon lividus]|nr:hypothetical protein BS17DRAFT_785513 [Gyrodon lividus]
MTPYESRKLTEFPVPRSILLDRICWIQVDDTNKEEITHHREMLALTPFGHPARVSSLNNIATALSTRFEQGGDRKDLEEAIQLHQEALALRHSKRSLFNTIISAHEIINNFH